ncbi:MAG: hypothetical protein AAGF12_01410 [Myxococcota bacterium]
MNSADDPLHAADPSAPIAAVVAVFQDHLSEVAFPDIDAQGLAELAENVAEGTQAVEHAKAEVERARDALDAARERLNAEETALERSAKLAHAYAKVYAESVGDTELQSRLATIDLNPPKKKPAPKRRRAKAPKKPATELPFTSAKAG